MDATNWFAATVMPTNAAWLAGSMTYATV